MEDEEIQSIIERKLGVVEIATLPSGELWERVISVFLRKRRSEKPKCAKCSGRIIDEDYLHISENGNPKFYDFHPSCCYRIVSRLSGVNI